jgi:hypothetical protein
MRRALVFSALLLAPLAAGAAVDPKLTALEAKVDLLQKQLDLAKKQLDLHLVQHAQLEPVEESIQAGLNDARRRDWERVLLECATSPGRCVIPQLLTSNALNAECVELDEEPDEPQAVFYLCPLKEIYVTVLRDLEAAQKQGLKRDFAAAQAGLDAAAAAIESGDPESAFWSACAAFKLLSCR